MFKGQLVVWDGRHDCPITLLESDKPVSFHSSELRFAWAPMVMAFVLAGVTSPTTMLGAIIGLAILMAASLHAKLNGRPF
jgi:hypothetical protein